MKKTMVILMMIVSVFAVESAFAGEAGKTADNGITVFDLGPASTCGDPAPADTTSEKKPFNGITNFDLGQPGSGAKGSCANGSQLVRTATASFYNGITVF